LISTILHICLSLLASNDYDSKSWVRSRGTLAEVQAKTMHAAAQSCLALAKERTASF
jgi:hypothetical protein